MRLLSFATGNLYRFNRQLDVVKLIGGLGTDGIEFTYGRFFEEHPITKSTERILFSKKEVSMHVHFRFLKKPEEIQKDAADFKKIVHDYKRIGAKRLVTHPTQALTKEMLRMGKKNRIQFLTENLMKRHGNDKRKSYERLGFEDALNKHKHFGLCLDVSHAYSWSKKETQNIFEKWRDRIMEVHFSVTHYQSNHLGTLSASQNFLDSVKCLKDLDVPIVIEEDMKTKNPKFILSEINRVKKITGFA